MKKLIALLVVLSGATAGAWSIRARVGCLILLALAISRPANVHAQAWTPGKGQGAVSLSYQTMLSTTHLWPLELGDRTEPCRTIVGKDVDIGPISSKNAAFDFDHGLSDRLAVSGTLAYVSSRYGGCRVHREADGSATEWDNGQYHGSFQDAELRVRYMALDRPLVVTPFLAYKFPTHEYAFFGHSHAGQHVWESRIGVSVARVLPPPLSEAYVQATYSHSYVSKIMEYNQQRNSAMAEIGYHVTTRLAVRALGQYSKTYGGFEWSEARILTLPNHDQIQNERYTRVGGGASYALGSNYQAYAVYYQTAWGENTDDPSSLTLGMSVNFETPFAR